MASFTAVTTLADEKEQGSNAAFSSNKHLVAVNTTQHQWRRQEMR